MADNVAGFNHLDEVLMSLGNQFRADAMKKLQMENQRNIAGLRAAHTGVGRGQTPKDIANIRAGLNEMNREKEEFIRTHSEKNPLTGEYTVDPATVEAEWMKENGPDYQAYQMALNRAISTQTPGLKLPSMQPKANNAPMPNIPIRGFNPGLPSLE